MCSAVVLAVAAIPSSYLVVTGEAGKRLWTLPLRPGASIILTYENSVYRAPAQEVFSATADGLVLTAVRSTSEAVLDYNGLAAPYVRLGPWYVAAASSSLPALTLKIGRTGRQHLIVDRRVLPLYEAGEGARVSIEVERAPRLIAALRRWILR